MINDLELDKERLVNNPKKIKKKNIKKNKNISTTTYPVGRHRIDPVVDFSKDDIRHVRSQSRVPWLPMVQVPIGARGICRCIINGTADLRFVRSMSKVSRNASRHRVGASKLR